MPPDGNGARGAGHALCRVRGTRLFPGQGQDSGLGVGCLLDNACWLARVQAALEAMAKQYQQAQEELTLAQASVLVATQGVRGGLQLGVGLALAWRLRGDGAYLGDTCTD